MSVMFMLLLNDLCSHINIYLERAGVRASFFSPTSLLGFKGRRFIAYDLVKVFAALVDVSVDLVDRYFHLAAGNAISYTLPG